jgi:hypothetical protein
MRRRAFIVLYFAAAVLFVTLGCESSGGSPTGPTPVTGAATVTGTIDSAITGGNSLISTGAAVQVAGSPGTAIVDANQSFTLSNVPPGSNVVLQFSGTGLDTMVPVGPVGSGETVVVALIRANNALQVDNTGRRSADGTEVQGVVASIGTTSFVVIGQTIQTDASTQFSRSSGATATFGDLTAGARVTVTGTPSFGSTLLAKTVRIEGAEVPIHLEGPISNLSGTATNFQFNVDSRIVHGDSTTAFDPGVTFASLTNGMQVDVTGTLTANFIQATRIQIR